MLYKPLSLFRLLALNEFILTLISVLKAIQRMIKSFKTHCQLQENELALLTAEKSGMKT